MNKPSPIRLPVLDRNEITMSIIDVAPKTARTMTMDFAVILVCFVLLTGCNPNSANQAFHRGRNLLIQGQFQAARTALDQFEKQYPNHELQSRTRLLQAKACMGLNDLPEAKRLFQQTIDQFPKSDEAGKARYKLAVIAMMLGDDADALERFEQLADQGQSVLAPEATAMVRYMKANQALPE